MKILHLLQSNHFSGAENVVCQIIDMLKQESDIQMVYSSRDGQIREELERRSVVFLPFEKLTVREVKRIIKSQKPDIIHAHDMRASFVASLSCGKIPLISHIHNNNFDSRKPSIKSLAFLIAAIKAKHIFWVSKSSFQGYAFHKFVKNKSEVLNNIIDVDALYKRMRQDSNTYQYDVVYIGRLTYPKNPKRLMGVCKILSQIDPQVKIAIVGTGDLEAQTKKIAKELRLDQNVFFVGFLNNPFKILSDSRVSIMTSRFEGTPMSALEAIALGVPVVSTPVDGLTEIVVDNINGFLIDDDEKMAVKIYEIIHNNSFRSYLSNNALTMSRSYNDLSKYRQRLINIYRSLND